MGRLQMQQKRQGKRPVFGVFSGGGIKGAAFLGAIEEAEKHVRFIGWGGTSAGSIVAALLACGYSSNELKEHLYNAPYGQFFRIRKRRAIFYKTHRGLVDPDPLLEWLRGLVGRKFQNSNRVMFAHLHDNQHLKIVATNITTQDVVVFSKADTPKVEIAQAVLASCSFPFLFPAVKHGQDDLVDGGVLSNFPMWLFDEERAAEQEPVPILGMTLVTQGKPPARPTILTHAFSVLESVLAAQDRIQEKYLDAPRLANVIRITIEKTPTFATKRSRHEHDSLMLAGTKSASKYFDTATVEYGRRAVVPFVTAELNKSVIEGDFARVISDIARQHILLGGVARDDGTLKDRVLVRYYIDLMEAVMDHAKLDALAATLAHAILESESCDRIVGIKKGNVILAYEVARLLKKKFSVFKTDMSYKMGPPFDGEIRNKEKIVIVDDVASDSSMLLNTARQINLYHAEVSMVATLIERMEGGARSDLMKQRGIKLRSLCRVDDVAIEDLIVHNAAFGKVDNAGAQ